MIQIHNLFWIFIQTKLYFVCRRVGWCNEWYFVHRNEINSFEDRTSCWTWYVDNFYSQYCNEINLIISLIFRPGISDNRSHWNDSTCCIQTFVQRNIQSHSEHVSRNILCGWFNNAHTSHIYILVNKNHLKL